MLEIVLRLQVMHEFEASGFIVRVESSEIDCKVVMLRQLYTIKSSQVNKGFR